MYDSFAALFITPRLNETFFTTPPRVIFHSTENVNLSTPGLSEHRFSHKSLGNIGKMVCTRYVVVPRSLASASSGVSGLTKCDTSAMCTPTFRQPSGKTWTLSASSKSRAVGGSMLKTSFSLKSTRRFISSGGIFQCSPTLTFGKHAAASALKSPLSMPCSATMTFVIKSKSSPTLPFPTTSMMSIIGIDIPLLHFLSRTATKTSSRSPAPDASVFCNDFGTLNSKTRPLGNFGSTGTNVNDAPPSSTSSLPTILERRFAGVTGASGTTRPVGRHPRRQTAASASTLTDALSSSEISPAVPTTRSQRSHASITTRTRSPCTLLP